MEPLYKAKSVHEAWVIAFSEAEEYQRLANINRLNKPLYEQFIMKRDVASSIAWRIKHGEKKPVK